MQRNLNEAAQIADKDRKAAEIEKKIDESKRNSPQISYSMLQFYPFYGTKPKKIVR